MTIFTRALVAVAVGGWVLLGSMTPTADARGGGHGGGHHGGGHHGGGHRGGGHRGGHAHHASHAHHANHSHHSSHHHHHANHRGSRASASAHANAYAGGRGWGGRGWGGRGWGGWGGWGWGGWGGTGWNGYYTAPSYTYTTPGNSYYYQNYVTPPVAEDSDLRPPNVSTRRINSGVPTASVQPR